VLLLSTAISDANDEEGEEWDLIKDDGEDRNGTRCTSLSARGASIGTGSLSFARAQRLTATALASRAKTAHPRQMEFVARERFNLTHCDYITWFPAFHDFPVSHISSLISIVNVSGFFQVLCGFLD
jgi:hypothetical protein